MPHAFIIAAAVTASVGAAIAFEVNVFKPWREENWTEGWAEGIKQEWDEFTESVRESFDDVCGDNTRFSRNLRQHQDENDRGNTRRRRRRNSDQEEEMELRREMDEFSQHQAQVSGVKARYADEFDQIQQGTRYRKGKNIIERLKAPLLDKTSSSFRLHNDNETLKSHSTSTHNDNLSPIAPISTPLSEGSNSARHSPSSTTLLDDNNFEDWQDHLVAQNTVHRADASEFTSDEGENDSETWTQLDDSRSASPFSAAWSETELSQSGR